MIAAAELALGTVPALALTVAPLVLLVIGMRNLRLKHEAPLRAALRTTTNLLGQLTVAAVCVVMVGYSYAQWYQDRGLAALLAVTVGPVVAAGMVLAGIGAYRVRVRSRDS